MKDSKIVEIYSAANSFEAHALVNTLKEDGIIAKVVGDILEFGSEGYPARPINPRIWVLEQDAIRAKELIKSYSKQ